MMGSAGARSSPDVLTVGARARFNSPRGKALGCKCSKVLNAEWRADRTAYKRLSYAQGRCGRVRLRRAASLCKYMGPRVGESGLSCDFGAPGNNSAERVQDCLVELCRGLAVWLAGWHWNGCRFLAARARFGGASRGVRFLASGKCGRALQT